MDEGVWGWSRHPNDLGMIAFWLGLFLFALAAGGGAFDGVGFAAMVILFSAVSVPLMEKRHAARRESDRDDQARVPVLVPWRLPRRAAPPGKP